jgi:ubiquitin carboxyl-terminal hydrolase 8
MSAAAPLPPPGPRTTNAMNGYPHATHGPGADTWRNSDGAGAPRGPGPARGHLYPSLAEIAASASVKVDDMRQSPVYAPTPEHESPC